MELSKKLKFDAVVKDAVISPFNPLFSKAKVHVLYTGHNRNESYFTKDSIIEALPSIFNIPVVGEYLVDKDNFGTHGGKVIYDEEIEDYRYIHTTMPYGTVPESVNIYWENVTESDGTVNEYLVLDGVLVWTGRYAELGVLLEQGKLGQSMEIEVVNGEFAVIDGRKTFKIDKFLFSSLCMLGVSKNGNFDEHVEPCFESANISVAYSLDKNKFTNDFNQMMKELKYSIDKEGGVYVTENVVDEVKEEPTYTVTDDFEINKEEVKLEMTEVNEPVVEEVFVEEVNVEESVVEESVVEEVFVEESVVEESVVEEVFVEESVVENKVVIEVGLDSELSDKFEKLSTQFESLKEEVDELRSFKRKTLEAELSAKFEDKLSLSELKEVFEKSKDISIDSIEKELFALVGKKNFTVNKEVSTEKIAIDYSIKEVKSSSVYGDLFEKHLGK